MAKFMYLGKYTADGLRGLAAEGGTKREAAIEKLVGSIGGTVLEYFFAVGEYDFVVIIDVPDNAAGLIAPILTGSTGTVRVVTVPLMSPKDMDEVCARIPSTSFRPAGQS